MMKLGSLKLITLSLALASCSSTEAGRRDTWEQDLFFSDQGGEMASVSDQGRDVASFGDAGIDGLVGDISVADTLGGDSGSDSGSSTFPPASYAVEDHSLVEPTFTGSCQADASSGFVHPGVLMDKDRLNFIKQKVKNKEEPWYSSYLAMANHYRFKNLNYPSNQRAQVDCGANNTHPNEGCNDLVGSSSFAYAQALQSYVEDDPVKRKQHATAAIRVLNEWSSVLRGFGTGINNMLVAGTAAGNFAVAAEIIKHTYAGAAALNLSNLRLMFCALVEELYKPTFGTGTQVNFRTIRNNGLIALGVFLDNKAIFTTGVQLIKRDFLGHVYMSKDGPYPMAFTHKSVEKNYTGTKYQDVIATMWGTRTFTQGQSQEFCRDGGHMAMGFAGAGHACVTAALQGVDLLDASLERIVAGVEFASTYLVKASNPLTHAFTLPSGICDSGKLLAFTGDLYGGYEALYYHITSRGVALPKTKANIQFAHSVSTRRQVNWNLSWTTLTFFEKL